MADLRPSPAPLRAELVRALRSRLTQVVPSGRLLAEGILGAESTIDLVAVEPEGTVVLLLVGEPGRDLELVGRALAQRAWVERRLADWLQLAPDLGVRPEAGVRVCLVCSTFSPETRAAAEALGAGALTLVRSHAVRDGSGADVLFECEAPGRPVPPTSTPVAKPGPPAPTPAAFRTGLTDEDLGLGADERAEFEPPPPRGDRGDEIRHR